MSRDDAFRVSGILRDDGVQGVVISGGEPTLLPYLADLAADLGKPLPQGGTPPRVVLSTNGLAPPSVIKRILPSLSWIALPLESANLTEHQGMRTGVSGHRGRVLSLLREVRQNHKGVQVKLGTVATKINVAGLAGVLDLIDDSCLPDIWKIYQMSATNYGADNRSWLELGDDAFENAVSRCADAAALRGVSLQVYRNSTREGSYLLIDPDCEVVVIDATGERRVGNLFDGLATGIDWLKSSITTERNVRNFTATYPDLDPVT
jgi:MoaA/NifB/PqqE/SkfB family radical SAM enzyme